MRLVVIESPYKGDVARNELYLRFCILDSVLHGESPYASHRMLTGALNDDEPTERKLGIELGLQWRRARWVDLDGSLQPVVPVFYVDFGWSEGMLLAKDLYDREHISCEVRMLPASSDFWKIARMLPEKKTVLPSLLGPKTKEFIAREIAGQLEECRAREADIRLSPVWKDGQAFPRPELDALMVRIADCEEALRELGWSR